MSRLATIIPNLCLFALFLVPLCLGGDSLSSARSFSRIPTTGTRSIKLPPIQTPMPPGPDQAAFMTNCIICHSPRYVLMQPLFSRKTWQAEVTKMKQVYGAPIEDKQMPAIVNYLVSVRGNGK